MLNFNPDADVLSAIAPLRQAGFACHWLHPKTKRPIGEGWSKAPVLSIDELRRTHAPGNNLGVRLGEVSAMAAGGFLHTFDVDIRLPDLADEAWATLRDLFPDIDIDALPSVISGSGGESRHRYFITDRPFYSKKLARSEGKHRGADGKWHYDWEIELFGGRGDAHKQVVLPPSIHPDTGQPYRWERPFDFTALSLGAGPHIQSDAIERIAEPVSETYEFETREPLTFEPGQLERDLDDIPVDRIDDYHEWIMLGQALHHQFGGSTEGYELWVEHSKRSEKFDGKGMQGKWRGFGRNRRQPVTMATVRQWALDERRARLISQFDEEDEPASGTGSPAVPAGAAQEWTTALHPSSQSIDIDSLLGESAPKSIDPLDDFDAATLADATLAAAAADWMSLLDFNEDGGVRPTLHNVELIMKNDPRLTGLPQLNEFTQETVQRRPPGSKPSRRRNPAKETRQLKGRVWEVKDPLNGDLWSDDRDFAIRTVLEAPKSQGGYGLKVSDRDLKAAVVLAANECAFHPVREYLLSLSWDRRPRVDQLFVRYLGSPDSPYSRDVARLMMVAAVTRIFEPGHKFDFAVILEGLQGRRKSTFIRILGRKWFAELDGDFHDSRQMVELMQGAWILEIPELSSFSRADVRSIKAFISRQTDRARLAYARRAGAFARQCIFVGSTNDREYLKDDTGGRRFWPVPCDVDEIDTDALEREIDQIWAEAVHVYGEMRRLQPGGTLPLFLRDEALREAEELQESRRVETEADALAGQIAVWLDKPIQSGSFDEDRDERGEPRTRDETCLIEIWCECIGGDRKTYNRQTSLTLANAMRLVEGWAPAGAKTFPGYGKQKMFFRGGRRARTGLPL